ncbi:hypothetical protein LQZ21_04010 [Treponema sp. TIM-1]|uniref:hypothetical protein n=1 Tax=Treponema sp. TIM-1 TaxID=2898417 RepID=UPI00397EDF7F
MLKKSLIFGSVVLFLAALITLTGCPTSVDDDSSGAAYAHRIYGAAVSPYQAQKAINRAVAAGEPIVLEDGLTISPSGHLNFKGARVRINGLVTFNGGVINVVGAQVEWAETGSLYLGPGDGAYIHQKGMNTNGVLRDHLVEYVDRLEDIMATAQAAAVSKFTLGQLADYDYSTDSRGIDARIVAEKLERLYVLDTLTLPIDGTAPSLIITGLGTVDVTGTRPNVTVGGTGANLTLGTCSILTTSQGGVIVYTPTGTILPNIEVQEGKELKIQAGAGALTIPGKLTGRGTLEITTAPTAIFIGEGDGNIKFSTAVNTPIPSPSTDPTLDIRSTGTVTFADSLTIRGGGARIDGNVEFNGNVDTTAAELSLNGNVTLLNHIAASAANPASGELAFGTNGLTLAGGKTISVKITPAGAEPVIAPVLTADSWVELTPAGNVTLTAADRPTRNNEDGVNAAKKIIVAGNNLEITDGTLQVAPGARFEIDGRTLTTNIDTEYIGYLAVADTGTLSLVDTGSVGIPAIGIGDTVITSPAASTLKASGGTVILGNNKIQGATAGAKLTAATGGQSPSITVDPASGTPGNKVLILQQVDLNLAGHGSLVITGVGVTANQVSLANLAKITLNNGEGGKTTDRSRIGNTTVSAILTGDYEGIIPSTATTSQAAWSLAHKGGANVSIIGGTNTVTLAKSGTAFVVVQ